MTSTLIQLICLAALAGYLMSCSLVQETVDAGKGIITTAVEVGKVRGQAVALKYQKELLDEIAVLQKEVSQYQTELHTLKTDNNPSNDHRIPEVQKKMEAHIKVKDGFKDHVIAEHKKKGNDCRFKFDQLICKEK